VQLDHPEFDVSAGRQDSGGRDWRWSCCRWWNLSRAVCVAFAEALARFGVPEEAAQHAVEVRREEFLYPVSRPASGRQRPPSAGRGDRYSTNPVTARDGVLNELGLQSYGQGHRLKE
jgi:hypothetical protein